MEEEPGIFYRICPRCARAVPASTQERYCLNDGERLLEACPGCGARITSPYARFCGRCGLELSKVPEGRIR
ncbi:MULTISPECIES: zinc ribbon domain-containing protein [unclassified Meiothermus]|uniref:double zinc ribbon domain-containing protein n=1 Tax=unclassified Meiothermus TaxID=370471 RepID=UPI0013144423|nr:MULTISPECIES: zinc ribbon domain-containing protein [unclassified Meiothermus]